MEKYIRGLSHGMDISYKSTITSAGVRVFIFSIVDSFFCVIVFILRMRLRTCCAGYLIGIKIIYQIYIYIILISVTGYKLPTKQASSKESHDDYQITQQGICQRDNHLISGVL